MRDKAALVGGVVVVCLALGLVEAAQLYFGDAGPGEGDWTVAVIRTIPSWFFLAVLAPIPVWTSGRWPFRGRAWGRVLAAHVGVALPFAFVHLVMCAWWGATRPGHVLGMGDALVWLASRYFVYDVICYAAVVGGVHALRYHQAMARLEREGAAVLDELRQARLKALDGQLHPHFVFNTLNAITGLAHRGDQRLVVETLTAFSELLHATLAHGSPRLVTLGREVELLESYVAIHRARFGDRIDVAWEIDDDTVDLSVPALLLQPLVENAVGHAIARNPRGGRVTVRARREGAMLVLHVADTGAGHDADGPGTPGSGTGLATTRARLEELFPGKARLDLMSGGADGTVVRAVLPAVGAERNGVGA
jgi:hypothetical protein